MSTDPLTPSPDLPEQGDPAGRRVSIYMRSQIPPGPSDQVTIDVSGQNAPETDGEQGLSTIELNGRELTLDGWYDRYALWHAKVTLTPQQAQELRGALEGTQPR